MDNRLMTSGDVARVANVSRECVSFWVKTGKLPVNQKTTAGTRLFDPATVATLVAERARLKGHAA